jgi:hypothetical protein
MLEILGYMVVAYGIARLLQTTLQAEDAQGKNRTVVVMSGAIGIGALIILALLLHEQASSVSQLGL